MAASVWIGLRGESKGINTPVTLDNGFTFATPTGASATSNWMRISVTNPALTSNFNALRWDVTLAPGETEAQRGLIFTLLSPATPGTGTTVGHWVVNSSTNTQENIGGLFDVSAVTTAGNAFGIKGTARNHAGYNVSVMGDSYTGGGTHHVGVVGLAETGTNYMGGYFAAGVDGHISLVLPNVTAGLVADNAATGAPIFLALDNGSVVFTIANGGGIVTTAGSMPTADPAVAGQLWSDGGTVKVSAG